MRLRKLLSKALIPFIALSLFITPVLAGVIIGGSPVISDGSMEATGTASWTSLSSGVLTKETTDPFRGLQNLRITYGGGANAGAYQSGIINGASYRTTGRYRTDGTTTALLTLGGGGSALTLGTSAVWEYFDGVVTGGAGGTFILQSNMTGAGEWVEYDEVTLTLMKGTPLAPSQLLADGDMELANITNWNAGGGAVLSKEIGSPYRGIRVLRVTRNGGGDFPYGGQIILTVGKQYRTTGRARGDGTRFPEVNDGSGAVWVGTSSTDWQSFDEIFITSGTEFRLYSKDGATAGYSEFDDVVVQEYKGVFTGGATVITDGDMETAGTGDWITFQNPTLTKETTDPYRGTQVLRVAYTDTANPAAAQQAVINGSLYRVTGWMRGDGTFIPQVQTGGGGGTTISGTTSTSWQYFDEIMTGGTGRTFMLKSNASSTGYAEFDDFRVELISN